jgi:hypothetical protein
MTTSTWRTGCSNIDIEKHLRRSEMKAAAQAQVWLALASELGMAANANSTAIQAPDPTLQGNAWQYWLAAWNCGGSGPSACNDRPAEFAQAGRLDPGDDVVGAARSSPTARRQWP